MSNIRRDGSADYIGSGAGIIIFYFLLIHGAKWPPIFRKKARLGQALGH
jgi:hypothetical protein